MLVEDSKKQLIAIALVSVKIFYNVLSFNFYIINCLLRREFTLSTISPSPSANRNKIIIQVVASPVQKALISPAFWWG
jgi:hypothetical protein